MSLPPLLRLPPELQLEILIYLPRFDQIIATQVCTTFSRLLSTKIITQTHYTDTWVSGGRGLPGSFTYSSPRIPPASETLHSAFERTHFLLEENSSNKNGVLILTAKAGKVLNYVYIHGDQYTEQEGKLWSGEMEDLDNSIKKALRRKRAEATINIADGNNISKDGELESAGSVSISTDEQKEKTAPGPGDLLDIDYEEWDSPTAVFFAENKLVTRFTGGRDLTKSSSLGQPFICPFITVPNPPDENEAMTFKFELDIYKDELLKGPKAPYTKKWEDEMVFKRDESVRDWIAKLVERIYVQAVEEGVTAEEKVWVTIQVARAKSEDAWIITTVVLRVSVEARKEMVWVRRKNEHFLLIKKEMWDKRAEWDLDSKEEKKNEDEGEKDKDEGEVRISYC
ncbi:hypothetical protein TWF506_007340 [Arthrobotrys conoides]|uniref:F-box domain-containing protein n=1 Tax=Arthrobotrys conoides TaxID=74498 RepID=A0AAN8NPK2_9PEZI